MKYKVGDKLKSKKHGTIIEIIKVYGGQNFYLTLLNNNLKVNCNEHELDRYFKYYYTDLIKNDIEDLIKWKFYILLF